MCYYGNVMITTRWWLCVTILHLQLYSHRLDLFFLAKKGKRFVVQLHLSCFLFTLFKQFAVESCYTTGQLIKYKFPAFIVCLLVQGLSAECSVRLGTRRVVTA